VKRGHRYIGTVTFIYIDTTLIGMPELSMIVKM